MNNLICEIMTLNFAQFWRPCQDVVGGESGLSCTGLSFRNYAEDLENHLKTLPFVEESD